MHQDVRYDERYEGDTSMDVYEPGGVGPHPAIMFIHGGGWTGGDKNEYTDAAKRLARTGWVAATINYRLAPKGHYPRFAQDCICALSYLRANAAVYHLDPDRIAVMGYSAGGHLASLVGVAADDDFHAPDCAWGKTGLPRAVVVGAGGTHDFRKGDDNWFAEMIFDGTKSEKPEAYAHASPITHVRAGLPPFLFVHGGADWWIDNDSTEAMTKALRAAGNDPKTLEVSGGGHLLQPTADGQVAGEESDLTAESWIAFVDFLDRHVRNQ